jgi:dipeptidyl aminopeptidase/acylaminoacyl peptidase
MIGRFCIALAALALLPVASVPAAAPATPAASDAASLYGARPGVEQISMSPSGNKIAYISPGPGQSTILLTVDAGGGTQPKQALYADGKPERIRSCFWVSEDRLVCQIVMMIQNGEEVFPFYRMLAINADGSKQQLLSRPDRADDAWVSLSGGSVIDALPGEDGSVLMTRAYVPEERQGTNLNDSRKGFGVDRIDTRNGSSRVVEQPRKDAIGYITDGRGEVRIMGTLGTGASGYARTNINYYYRKKGSRDWQPLSVVAVNGNTGFDPYAVDPNLDVVYGLKRANGRAALYSVALDGSGKETMIYAHPEVDVDDLISIGRSRRIVGAAYVTEKRQAAYFDPALQALGRSLSRAIPGLPIIQFIDSSSDENKLLIRAGSDTDPGRYFIYDKSAKRLAEIMVARPELEGATLAQVKPITYKAADGTDVPAYLTLPPGSNGKNLPAIVMPHGGPGARDEWGFDWLSQYFAARGYAVLQPNFRGSAGYGDVWFKRNGYQSWRSAVGDVNDAGRWLVGQGIADPSKLAILGWSYGGYAALQANVLDPDLFHAVVAIAPVTDLALFKQGWMGWSNYRIMSDMIGSGPHLTEGSPAQNAARFKAPVLLFHGDRDFNVSIRQSRAMADRLKDAGKRSELVVYDDLDHYLEDGSARADMLRRSDAFLRASLGIQ